MIPQALNDVVQSIRAFGDIPATYSVLTNLEKETAYTHLILVNTTDQPVTLKFLNSAKTVELQVDANMSITLDNFPHWDVILYKYTSAAPTSGFFQQISWGG